MITPKNLKKNDTIAYSSMSNGITKEKKINDLLNSKKLLHNFNIIEDKYIYNSVKGASANAIDRSRELTNLIEAKNVKAIFSVTGGDFLNEILDYINDLDITKNIKWFQGQSDSTLLLYYLTTKYNLKTIYSFNANSLSKATNKEVEDNIKVLCGEKIKQYDYNGGWKSTDFIEEEGIIIGGCLECLIDLIGTKFDYTAEFMKKNNKIIWFFDIDYMKNETLLRNLWHLRNAGWFEKTNLIIFGRNDEQISYVDITQNEAISRGLNGLDIKYITDFDLGHTFPRITIVNGSHVKITYNQNEKSIDLID